VRLVEHDWPGNVRELRGVVRQIVVTSRGEPTLRADASLTRTLSTRTETKERRAADIPRQRILAALREHRWSIGKAARALGITRNALYRLAETDPEIRRGSELDKQELERLLHEHEGNLETVAESLRVSPRALRLRLRALGLA
jgi:two-component system nitrogen regulation response regulator GlnG